jgi:heptosyltransferase-2
VVPPDQQYVCVAPASVWFTKQLPAAKWMELIDRIPRDHQVFLIGGPRDAPLCQEIRERTRHPRVEIKAGELTLMESAALISRARMTFTNDSAPLHLASAMNAPVTAAFCSTIPGFGFGPLSDVSHIVETERDMPCRPCGLHGKKACEQGHFLCGDIDVKKMVAASRL